MLMRCEREVLGVKNYLILNRGVQLFFLGGAKGRGSKCALSMLPELTQPRNTILYYRRSASTDFLLCPSAVTIIHLSFHLTIYLCMYIIYIFIYLSIHPTKYLCMYIVYTYLSIYYLYIHLYVYLSTCLSISQTSVPLKCFILMQAAIRLDSENTRDTNSRARQGL